MPSAGVHFLSHISDVPGHVPQQHPSDNLQVIGAEPTLLADDMHEFETVLDFFSSHGLQVQQPVWSAMCSVSPI